VSIWLRDVGFGFEKDKPLFRHFSLDIGDEGPVVILGSSGCGKTTLLRLMAGLLKPDEGTAGREGEPSFVFQENRLLPWYTALENTMLPIEGRLGEGRLGKSSARERALRFLRLVDLEEKAAAYPAELSGGQARRASIARAFAFPSPVIFMDEPFQSLDVPLRLQLMDMVRSLLAEERRLAVMVTHDPREAVYLGRRVLVLGRPPEGIVFDECIDLKPEERSYGSAVAGKLEAHLLNTAAAAFTEARHAKARYTTSLHNFPNRL
jgi:NitT/TauT family transport system ATP-binding protein